MNLEFTKNLESNEIHDALKDAVPDSEIHGYRVQGSRRYHYEEIEKWPENFIVLGDAVSIFNPFLNGRPVLKPCPELI